MDSLNPIAQALINDIKDKDIDSYVLIAFDKDGSPHLDYSVDSVVGAIGMLEIVKQDLFTKLQDWEPDPSPDHEEEDED